MDAPKVRYIPNPRFNADGIPVYFGSSQDSRILYDAAGDEWTLQTKDAGGTFQDRVRVEANTNTPDVDLVDNPIKWSSGRAVTAADYSIGRDVDGTNQLHINVPAGATFEFSVNDVAEAVLSATDLDLKNNTISNVGGAGNDLAQHSIAWSAASAAGDREIRIETTDNGSNGSTATLQAKTGRASGGDPRVRWDISGGTARVAGGDNDQSDRWAIGPNAALGGQDAMRFTTANPSVMSLDTTQGVDFDYVCETCGTHSGESFICHGVYAAWHGDVAALVPVFDALGKTGWLTGQEAGVQHLAHLGVLDVSQNNDGTPWIGMNIVRVQWYTWASIWQNRQRIDAQYEEFDQRIKRLETA